MSRCRDFEKGEVWRVLAQTGGEGIGLPRGTKILVKEVGQKLKLMALDGDWENSPELVPMDQRVPAGDGRFDPVWCWEATKDGKGTPVERPDGLHAIKVGLVENDPGVCVIFVNPHGTATIER